MKIKAIAFDLDGTLLGTDEKIRPESIKAMLEVKEKGIKIIICTGRPLEDALIPLEGLQKDIFDYAILNNGTYEYDFSNKEIKLNGEINKDILHIFKKIGIKHKALFAIHIPRKAIRGDFFDGEEPEWFENIEEKEEYLSRKKIENISTEEIFEVIKDKKITQLSYRVPLDNVDVIMKELIKSEVDKKVSLFVANSIYVDFTPKGMSKDIGIKKLIERLGIDISEVLAFGDSGNDIEMLANAGMGVAMSNASKEAKEASDIVIGNNDTDAIANKIRKMVK